MPPHEDDVDNDVPLQHKKAFGSSLKLKKVDFVKASDGDLASTRTNDGESGKAVSDLYLSVVMKNVDPTGTSSCELLARNGRSERSESPATEAASLQDICGDCNLPLGPIDAGIPDIDTSLTKRREITVKHNASIAHQVSLSHSHPPSAISRQRMGLVCLEACGWDPDSRKGLGVNEQGIPHPLKPKPKDDNLGVGLEIPKEVLKQAKKEHEEKENRRVKKMKAKDRIKAEKQRDQRLHDLFYARTDVLNYLGEK